MLVDRLGRSVDFIKRIQLEGNLENAWPMFDYVKRIQAWTTMVCHVYYARYCKVITIILCDMQPEDMKV
jgi:hypothetical protein